MTGMLSTITPIRFLASLPFILLTMIACNNSEAVQTPAAGTNSQADAKAMGERKTIVFFGNSLTAGYGLEPGEAFPALIQEKINAKDLPYKVVNAGVSGETSAGGNTRINWVLKQQPVDVFVLELGANDGLRGIPVQETRKNLQSIIDKVKKKNADAILIMAGMQVPPNMGRQYATDFKEMFVALAQENNMLLIPFLLEGVGGVKDLNQADGIHPTAEGARIMANNVWDVLQDVITDDKLK